MNNEQKQIKTIISNVTQRSQVTIPTEVRRVLGIKPRAKLIWKIVGDEVQVKPSKFSIKELYGSVKRLHPEINWKEAEQIAKDEKAKRTIDELNKS
jgi:bifunctional DNA-binding transcriptional regulator/antitoxin component of YhaV-PrlF toxin-antitoxin module